MPHSLPERIIRHLLEQGIWKNQLSSRLILLCLAMLFAASLIWITLGRKRYDYQITSLYWLSCGVGVWLSLILPPQWIIPSATLAISLLSFSWACIPAWIQNRRYHREAWPDSLMILLERYQPAHGMIASITVLSILCFFLGLCYITSPMTVISATLTGIALMTLVHHNFNPEAALVGMVMITLAFVSAFFVVFSFLGDSVPTLINLAIIPLAYMSFHWFWLGNVWSQQMDGKTPLTTAAKLVFLTRHTGIMMLGFATLLAVKLSFWPILPAVSSWDNSLTRFILLGLAYGILILVNFWVAKNRKSFSLSILVVINVFCAQLAFITRLPNFFESHFLPHLGMVILLFVTVIFIVGIVFQVKSSRNP